MFVILMDDSPVNIEGLEGLKRRNPDLTVQEFINLTQPENTDQDNELIILDLNADGELQKLGAPTEFVKDLMGLNIGKHINLVHLIVSDVLPENSLLPYAEEMAQA